MADIDTGLIVSSVIKATEFIKQQLSEFSVERIVIATSVSEARRLLNEQDFDIVIINSPLKDETGERLSRDITSKYKSQVALLVNADFYDDVSRKVEDFGVITVSKPINRNIFWFSLKLAKASHKRLSMIQNENAKLISKIEDIKIIDRAKHLLVSYLNMSEEEAHKHIEKQAMDGRITRRAVAERILKIYEDR